MHQEENLLNDPTTYRQLVWKLMYLTITRPDISYSVHVLTQFMDKPCEKHMNAAFKVLKYLKKAPGQGIFMSATSELQLKAYSDSDWAGCICNARPKYDVINYLFNRIRVGILRRTKLQG